MEILSLQKMVLMMMIIMLVSTAKSDVHCVGGDKHSWRPNVNFTKWSLHEHFRLKDWLYFGYDRDKYNALEVNKSSYENCIDKGFIQNISWGAGGGVFELKEFKTYYFLSGGGYCWQGMKVAINVTEGITAPTPAPSPSPKSSAPPVPSPESGAPAPSPKSDPASNACSIQTNQILLVFIFILMWGISSNNISY